MITINENTLRKIIKEALSEVNGSLNNTFHYLAEFIVKKYRYLKRSHGDYDTWSFMITKDEFARFNAYYKLPYPKITVNIVKDNGRYAASCGPGCINITHSVLLGDYSELISTIEHELTHLVQLGGNEKKHLQNTFSLGTHGEKGYNQNYCFSPDEMSARISEAYRFAEQQLESYLTESYFFIGLRDDEEPNFQDFYKMMWECLDDENTFTNTLSETLHLDEMQTTIEFVEDEDFETFSRAYRGDENVTSLVYSAFRNPPHYLSNKMNRFFHELLKINPYDIEDVPDEKLMPLFERYKAYLLKYYKTAFAEYKKKVNKTLAPLAMKYFEKGCQEFM